MLYNICAILIHINVRYFSFLLPHIYIYFQLSPKTLFFFFFTVIPHKTLNQLPWTDCENQFNCKNSIVHLSQEGEKEESEWKMMVQMVAVGRGTLSVNKTCYTSLSWTDSCSSFSLTFRKSCGHLHLFKNPLDYREPHANHRILTIIRLICPPWYLCIKLITNKVHT